MSFFLSSCKTTSGAGSAPVSNTPISHSNLNSYIQKAKQKEDSCPHIDKIANNLKRPETMAHCGYWNAELLKEISHIKPGGGYNLHGSPSTDHLCVGPDCRLNVKGSCTTSYCSGATYTAFINLADRAGAFKHMTAAQLENFKTDKADNFGFWGLWNNNYGGVADANRYARFGKSVSSLSSACPGDLVKASRHPTKRTYRVSYRDKRGRKRYTTKTKYTGSGHSFVYLGQEEGRVYYWSSNTSTGGFGISCEPISRIQKAHIVRITNPKGIANIKPYKKQNLLSSLPAEAEDSNDYLVENADPAPTDDRHI